MPHTTTIFERDTLYSEIWKEPVSTVAGRYGISDVALRKICQRLGVPVPPLGYWARVAAGQHPKVPPLPAKHAGETRYVRSTYVDPEEEERKRRIEDLLAQRPLSEEIAPALRASIDECHPLIRRTAKGLGPRSRDERGLLCSDSHETLDVAVSESNRDRALLILDAVITAATGAGAVLCKATEEGSHPRLELLGVSFAIGITEATRRSERELTKEELKKQREGTLYYIPRRWAYSPTGTLKLVVSPVAPYVTDFSIADSVKEPLEQRLGQIPALMHAKAAEAKVRGEMREEERRRWQLAEERREALQRRHDEAMARLEEFEKDAAAWRRAKDLRAYALALEALSTDTSAGNDPQGRANLIFEVAWIRRAADWLDPLVQARWPEADGTDLPGSAES